MAGLGGFIGSTLGGLAGNAIAGGDFQNSRDAADRSYQELINLGKPPETAKALVLEKFKSAGLLTPELEQHIQSPAVQLIAENPQNRQQQEMVQNVLKQAAMTGNTAQGQADQLEMEQRIARDINANKQALVQNMQARGMGGSGAELAAALMGQQSGANQMATQGIQNAAKNQAAAMNALNQYAQNAGNIRNQDLSTSTQNAGIQNQFNRFQTQDAQALQARNIAAKNQAQQANLGNQQQIGNANTQMTNAETARQNQARATDWGNQVGLAGLKSNAYGNQAKDFQARGQRTANQYGEMGGAIGSIAGMAFAHGGVVPGNAPVPGDHPANDIVPAHLSPGELVLPRSIMDSHNPGDVAKKFVDYVQALNKKPEYKYGKDGK